MKRSHVLGVLGCMTLAACARSAAPPAPEASATPPAIAYEAHLAAGGIAPAGGALRNPHAGDAAVAKAGEQLFSAMNCDGCHNLGATGWVAPNLGDGRWRYGGADAEVFSSIYYGRPKGMPAFGGVLGADGVWTLVTYIRSLPLPSDVPTESWEQP
ncbi:MAG TPA: c-type cytochrome [Steroidobacteraceae bacterium]|nr:c-type cytochrome [Steroidobacteraceae bacterium]